MKKSLRIASSALALTLAAGMTMPAFAASSSSFTKSENVYVVMNADGSVQSTTVSEHLYNAGGLSSVTDVSSLTNIQNTESDAAFTQDGEKLVWNTDDTDVYYKGDTDRALPIGAKVTYTLDGTTDSLENLIGKSGHLKITVDLTNYETGTVTVNGKERTIGDPAGHGGGRHLRGRRLQPERRPRHRRVRRQEQRGCLCLPPRRQGFPERSAAR